MNPFNIRNTITILVGAIVSCFIGFYNGFPLVYPDTGTYLDTGFAAKVPLDRTIFYGLFIRHISLSASPWLVIFSQGLIICSLLYLTLGIFFKGLKRNLFFLFSVVFLTVTTGFSFNVSILIPDIFSPIALLCLINLLVHPQLGKLRTLLVSVLFVFSLSTHLSNILTFGVLLLVLFAYIFIKKNRDSLLRIKKILFVKALLFSALLLVPTVHYLVGNKFQYSNGSHVFMVNHLIETGILKQYLDDECENSNYKICGYKNELVSNFMWSKKSPLYKTGGWVENKEEYNKILLDIYSSPKYWTILTQKTIEYTFKQFFSFDIDVGFSSPHRKGSGAFDQINWRFHDYLLEFINSKQNSSNLNLSFINFIQTVVILLSLIISFVITAYPYLRNMLRPDLKWTFFIVLIYGVLNSAICANISTVVSRYQNRWIWILPIIVIIALYYMVGNKKFRSQMRLNAL